MAFDGSARLFKEARRYAPAGVHSNFRLGAPPRSLFYERAEGSKLYDVDGNEYVDYALGMGPGILGHAAPPVIEAVARSLERGQLFAGQHRAEVDLAREICRIVPCAERIRLSLTGTEAVQSAIRLSRAATRRSHVVKFEGHYHGWSDNIYVSVKPDVADAGPQEKPYAVAETAGQDPFAYQDTYVLPFNDEDAFRAYIDRYGPETACVILEPICCNTSVIQPEPAFLRTLRKLTSKLGIILIFDEVITGFRVALGGAQQLLGVTPDLAIFAKALADGFPVSCIAGRADLMDRFGTGEVMHGGTFNSGVLSCVAALATVTELVKGTVYKTVLDRGTQLMEGLQEAGRDAGRPFLVQGLPAVFNTAFTDQKVVRNYRDYAACDADASAAFVGALAARGVRVTSRGTWFLSGAHTAADIEFTIDAARDAVRAI